MIKDALGWIGWLPPRSSRVGNGAGDVATNTTDFHEMAAVSYLHYESLLAVTLLSSLMEPMTF
jgi:hypothetical protein